MKSIKKIGIVGAGKMGSDIFSYLFEFDFSLSLYCYTNEELERLDKLVRRKFRRFRKYAFLTELELAEKEKNITIHQDIDNFKDCDLIIESIPEKLELKGDFFKDLDKIVKPDCIFTSNSSSIIPARLKSYVSEERALFGLHFFYPLSIKEHVEIVIDQKFQETSLCLLRDFVLSIRKTYLIQDESSAFVLNRIFLEIQLEAFRLFKNESYDIALIDKVAKDYFSEVGIFEFMDHVGIDTMLESVRNYSFFGKNRKRYEAFIDYLETMVVSNKLGIKSGVGFYNYNEDRKVCTDVNSAVFDEIRISIDEKLNSYLEFVSKMKYFDVCKLNTALKEYTGIDKEFIN